ncbi:MAG: alpha/beta fold hydrolase [Adhaeribacter sp.]
MDVLKRNNVQVSGQGRQPMLFAHGYGCDQTMWRFITPAFEQDYQIVLFDHIGFGNSDAGSYSQQRYSSLQAYADDILEICAALDLQNTIFVGHSVGAMLGVLAALREPGRFAKLVLLAPSPSFINDGQYTGGFTREALEGMLASLESDYLGWAHNLAPVVMGNPNRPELSQELEQAFCHSNEEVAKDFARLTFLADNRRDVGRVHLPVLILQCSDDALAPLGVGEFLHKEMQGSTLQVLEATGHCPNLSAPAETIAAMKSFI